MDVSEHVRQRLFPRHSPRGCRARAALERKRTLGSNSPDVSTLQSTLKSTRDSYPTKISCIRSIPRLPSCVGFKVRMHMSNHTDNIVLRCIV